VTSIASSRSRSAAIVICLDDRFVPPARAMLESIGCNGGELDGVSLVALTRGLTRASVEALEQSAARAGLPFLIRQIPDVNEIGGVPGWAVSTCLRLYVGDMCGDFERVLYLDSDLLILRELAPLIDHDYGEHAGAAVLNHPPLNVMRVAIPHSRRGDVDGDAPYFNAGVLLFDTARWNSRAIGRKSREFMRRFPATRLFDQDALNVAMVNDWSQLGKEWNVPAGPLDDAPMMRGLARMSSSLPGEIAEWTRTQHAPGILHFTGQPKPWENGYPWPKLAQLYAQYMLPEFGSSWPSTQAAGSLDASAGQRVREFRRA
jgi:lipopolysaccharide biosynthesis glycosyltransferase